MRALLVITAVSVGLAGIACTQGELPTLGEPRPLHLPAGTHTTGPRLSSGNDTTLLLSWMQRDEVGATLRFSRLEGDKWQMPIDVVSDPDMFVNWADLPSVMPLAEGHWAAHWLSKSAATPYAYDVLVAHSSDNGQSWSAPIRPHRDGTPTEHGFVSMHAAGDSTSLIWLDGRNTAVEVEDAAARSMTLRSAEMDSGGRLSREQVIDDRVCDCCQTDIAISSNGPIAVYRNRTVDEIRDIYVSRFTNGTWQPGTPIADDGWLISGCPVNGPAIDAEGDLVAIAWFSGANDKTVVNAVLSRNGGRTFKEPVEVATSRVSGHVGVAVVDRASVVVSWVESDNRGTNAINLRGLTAAGELGVVTTVGRSNLLRIYPQMARIGDRLILAWTDEIMDASEIVSIEVPIIGFYERLR